MRQLSRRTFLGMTCAAMAGRAANESVIDIHQHTNYSGRTNAQLVTHQRAMGIAKSVLLPAGSKYGLAADAGGNDTVLALAREYPKEYVFFANELPDIPETRKVIEKYLKLGAIGIGEQKFAVDCDSKHMRLIADIAKDYKVPVLDALSARDLQFRHRALPQDAGSLPYRQLHRSCADMVGKHRQEPQSACDVSQGPSHAGRYYGPAAYQLSEHVRRLLSRFGFERAYCATRHMRGNS